MKEPILNSDQRSKKFIFVPFCLLCQAFQAQGIVRLGFTSTLTPILQELIKLDVNIIQMPCPESKFGGYLKGLNREPKGISKYDISEFRKLCEEEANEVALMIDGILANGYKIVGILGIEYSPSCAVNLQYSGNYKTIRQTGLFISALQGILKQKSIDIPFVGINRRAIRSSINKIKTLFENRLID